MFILLYTIFLFFKHFRAYIHVILFRKTLETRFLISSNGYTIILLLLLYYNVIWNSIEYFQSFSETSVEFVIETDFTTQVARPLHYAYRIRHLKTVHRSTVIFIGVMYRRYRRLVRTTTQFSWFVFTEIFRCTIRYNLYLMFNQW